MKKLLLIALAGAALTGCSNLSYSVTRTDGSKEEFRAYGFFSNKHLAKLSVGKKTEKTSQGLGLGSADDQVATDAIKAAGDVVATVTQAAVAGAIKGAK